MVMPSTTSQTHTSALATRTSTKILLYFKIKVHATQRYFSRIMWRKKHTRKHLERDSFTCIIGHSNGLLYQNYGQYWFIHVLGSSKILLQIKTSQLWYIVLIMCIILMKMILGTFIVIPNTFTWRPRRGGWIRNPFLKIYQLSLCPSMPIISNNIDLKWIVFVILLVLW